MEKNKYYTPTIDEFHVGFEYEYKGQILEFLKYNHPVSYNFSLIKDELELGYIKTKYLDREDIESLGFDLRSEDEFYSKDNKYNIYTGNKNIEIYSEGVCFIGRIKNKSELKRILKMIGYEQ